MKKVFLLPLVLLLSFCANEVKQESVVYEKDSVYRASTQIDTTEIDSIMLKATSLLNSTENSENKVRQMKKIVNENKELKKEALVMKAEIISITKERDVLIEEVNNHKKKNLIQRVIEAIKDTTNKDTTKQ